MTESLDTIENSLEKNSSNSTALKPSLGSFAKIFWHRFNQNKLTQAAGSLTYSTMLAIVPLVMVVFSIFTAFPMFNEMTGELKTLIFTNFAPAASDVVGQYIDEFVNNSKQMSGVGVVSLILVALLLISNIDRTINDIWKAPTRSMAFSFAIYWTILSLGPILMGASFAVSSYVSSMNVFDSSFRLPFGIKLLGFVPFLLTWLGFTFIYAIVPNQKVKLKYAAAGALVAAIFFTLGKKAFAWYIVTFPSYQVIYGAMATLPLMLLWLQLSWLFILLGAQLSAVLQDFNLLKRGQLDLTFLTQKTKLNQIKKEEQ